MVKKKNTTSRRGFFKQSLAVAAPLILPASVLGRGGAVPPSERIVLGAIGVGPRGRHDLDCMLSQPDVQFVAVCDVQAQRRQTVKTLADQRYRNTDCQTYRDFRELLARPEIDAVLIATGDHWHALASILAAKAGKHVYSEKPCGLTMSQCQALDDVVKRTGIVYQAGTQRRSVSNFQAAIELAHRGKLGKLTALHASAYYPGIRYDWLPAQPEPPKEVIDWDLWLGPSPWRPYNIAYVQGGWRAHFDFESGARLLDWGAHTLDLCQWANQADNTMPVEYEPTATNISCRYANGVRVILDFLREPFRVRAPHYRNEMGTCPVRFEGEEGWVETGDTGRIAVHPESLRGELLPSPRSGGLTATEHARNFFDCIKSGGLPHCNSTVMRHSHLACQAAAIAWMLNRKLTFDPVREAFVNDEEANRLCSRALREPWHV